ncbi:hypothetical protein CANMA_000243 [Candida margitis]|uniref:uncharacterized protein n=1 Tax=Candida margitis TaxID=1775924 RepID=UPI002226F07B|nr:uncharacterized protein CANMA_000243 [Candida margitis]KAI5970652.1 hypothetical protein CANMA_000243 [Candida margitis]
MSDIDNFKDPILSLTRYPNLTKDEAKSSQIVHLIKEISERRLNKLCSTTYILLQTLDNIQLKLKSWEFLSLDYNSNTHFANADDKIKIFNTGVADKVMQACSELNFKLAKISADIDLISKSSSTLSVSDVISDEGTILTSLLLRVIKLKDEIIEQLSISYSKAKLILIGRDLELLHRDDASDIDSDSDSDSNDDDDDEDGTVNYYKTFIVTLLKQLNDAILANDFESKHECLAVINDLEKMFEKYKMEKMIDKRIKEHDQEQHQLQLHQQQHHKQQQQQQHDYPHGSTPKTDLHFGFDEDTSSSLGKDSQGLEGGLEDTFSEYSMTSSAVAAFQGQLPMVRSITQSKGGKIGVNGSTGVSDDIYDYETNSSSMYKSSITEELPYLRTAFRAAKNFENDVSHYKQEVGVATDVGGDDNGSEKENSGSVSSSRRKRKQQKKQKKKQKQQYEEEGGEEDEDEAKLKQPFFHKVNNLPQSSLYAESKILQPQTQFSAPTPFLNTNSLLRTLGIQPQVINVPYENTMSNGHNSNTKQIEAETKEQHEKHQSHQQKYLPLSEENVLHLSHEYID